MSAAASEVLVPELAFDVEDVRAAEHGAVPTLCFQVRIDAGGAEIRALALNAQLRVDAARRSYEAGERERLFELFGAPPDWARTVRSLRWTNATLNVPSFTGTTTVELPVPCTYDFDVAAAKYLHALDGGEVPLELLFSGTLFFGGPDGRLQVVHLPWDREARCALPVAVWREALERAFPGTAWLRIDRDLFDRLQAYKSSRALLTWDATLEQLLEGPRD